MEGKENIMGLYGGIKDANHSEGGVYLTPGVYRLEVQALKTIKARAGKSGFVAEFVILEASGDTKLKPGNTASWMTMEGDNFLGNVEELRGRARGELPGDHRGRRLGRDRRGARPRSPTRRRTR